MIFTNSVPVGITILALFPSNASRASSFLNNWAFPTKYLSAASFTSLMASASPSATPTLSGVPAVHEGAFSRQLQ
jgi:hypothetical protein